jgi:hypothetical protein
MGGDVTSEFVHCFVGGRLNCTIVSEVLLVWCYTNPSVLLFVVVSQTLVFCLQKACIDSTF